VPASCLFAASGLPLLGDAEVREALANLHVHYVAAAPDDLMAGFTQGAIRRLAGNPAMAPSQDARITAAPAWMRARLARSIRLDDVAAEVHLSPGRFRHLFASQTGTSLRAWLLWMRMERAVTSAFQGRSWTEAAHEAGFADAAHRTRTCRRMIGLAPSMRVPEAPSAHT
jgi:AraC-like DNA-binding protein